MFSVATSHRPDAVGGERGGARAERVGMRVLTVIDRNGERRYRTRGESARRGAGAAGAAAGAEMLTRFGEERAGRPAQGESPAKAPWASVGGAPSSASWLSISEHDAIARRRSLSNLPKAQQHPAGRGGARRLLAAAAERKIRTSHASVRYAEGDKGAPPPSVLSV